ncbi:hypothetical protein HD806DRAFT_474336 [Xylariaceae sp. AK1471]|nr:hypothetical protein HD806DRAFT_474336 [Xylariaceae sp. AK1471]
MSYTYSRLGRDQIRLLRLGLVRNDSDLYLEIFHIARDKAPPYAAVSYTWGDAIQTESVYLDNRVFRIRRNLWSCLYYLTLNAAHSRVKHIWVDAICIDQSSNEERTAQVRVMDEIYRNASYVSVWLGLAPLPNDQFSLINQEQRENARTCDIEPFVWTDHAKELANHPYWTRYWVIQECLCARDIQIHCSGNIIHWEGFRDVLFWEGNLGPINDVQESLLSPAEEKLGSLTYGALPLLLGRGPEHGLLRERPLHALLVHHRHSQCKDARDRVFAFLGLLALAERAMLEKFFPNYALSEDRVVIIALAHVRDVNLVNVTVESEELFCGLGVESKVRRRRLLWAAGRFFPLDYVKYVLQPGPFAEYMTEKDEIDTREYEQFEQWEDARPREGTSDSCCIL